jgi:hypothetical protein
MRQFLIAATAVTAFATLSATAPAKAEVNFGPLQNAGQCWTSSQGYGRDARFGYWSACPKTASVAVTRTTSRVHPHR